jgi:hydroxypyruvate isomerase
MVNSAEPAQTSSDFILLCLSIRQSGGMKHFPHPSRTAGSISRRAMLKTTAAGALAGAIAGAGLHAQVPAGAVPSGFKVTRGRIRQSVMGWCFSPMPVAELARACKEIGLVAMEGIGREHYPLIRELGLEISLLGSHGFARGPFNRANHEFCLERLREAIDLAPTFGCKRVITFTGMREPGISEEEGAQNCVDCWKEVIGQAEEKGVELCLEHLNSRDDTHPMKGHPGYFGDDVDLCVDLIQRVDSPNMKLLFDIYHVQIMNGDVIRRIRQYKDYISHYHTAGVPGRGELDETQEVNYPAIMKAIIETGFDGYVAQEFIPTWPDKIQALRHAAMVCDV